MRRLLEIVNFLMKFIVLVILWVVYLPVNIMDFFWTRFIDPSDSNQEKGVTI